MPSSTSPAPLPARSFFVHLSRPLLVRLLSPFEAALAAHSFSCSVLAAAPARDRAAVHALHDLLDAIHTAGAAMPEPSPFAPLFDLLAAVARVASPAGREALIRRDAARRLPARLGAEDLAATAYLDFPDLFASVRVSPAADAIKGFVLYEASPASHPRFGNDDVQATARFLGEWFEARHRTAYCDLLVRRRDGELHFEITHGKTPITHDLIDDALATQVVTQVSTQRSYAVYYESSRVLAVHALEFVKEGIRTSFGHGFGEGAEHFTKTESLLDMSPLRDLDAALAPDLDLGVKSVELRWIDVTSADGSGGSHWAGKGDVRASNQNAQLRAALASEGAHVTYVKMAIELASARRALLVEITAPRNQLVYDRRDPGVERALLAWLSARGVWLGGRRDESDHERDAETLEASA